MQESRRTRGDLYFVRTILLVLLALPYEVHMPFLARHRQTANPGTSSHANRVKEAAARLGRGGPERCMRPPMSSHGRSSKYIARGSSAGHENEPPPQQRTRERDREGERQRG